MIQWHLGTEDCEDSNKFHSTEPRVQLHDILLEICGKTLDTGYTRISVGEHVYTLTTYHSAISLL
jgi:hypothetical protein